MANIATKKLAKADNNLYDALGIEEETDAESWEGVPEFVQKKKDAAFTVNVNFRNKEDLDKFADLVGMPNLKLDAKRNRACWFPPLKYGERGQNCLCVWYAEDHPDMKELLDAEKKGKK